MINEAKVSILGCGWLGLSLAERLSKEGFIVKGSTTSKSKIKKIEKIGASPFSVDLVLELKDIQDFLDADILIVNIPLKDVEAFKRFIFEIEKSSIQKVIFISSTSVYPFTNGIITEESEVKDTALLTIENQFRKNVNFETTVLRFGGLFGYDRNPANFIKADRVMENPDGFVNLIHRDDCVEIIRRILELKRWNETFNACADTHPTRREFYTKQAEINSKLSPEFVDNLKSQYKIINSDKLKEELHYEFKHADLMAINLKYAN